MGGLRRYDTDEIKSRSAEQNTKLLFSALLPAGSHQHIEISECLTLRGHRRGNGARQHLLNQQERRLWPQCSMAVLEDGEGLRIVPIVDDVHQQIGIAIRWNLREHVARYNLQPVGDAC